MASARSVPVFVILKWLGSWPKMAMPVAQGLHPTWQDSFDRHFFLGGGEGKGEPLSKLGTPFGWLVLPVQPAKQRSPSPASRKDYTYFIFLESSFYM